MNNDSIEKTINKKKKISRKKTGDIAEKFVFEIFIKYRFLTEIHPRTFRLIHIKGRTIQIAQDNDYHHLFDIKAEGPLFMIYAQVKFEEEKVNTTTAQKNIDREYPYEFPYQRLQTWQVWDEWIKPEKGRIYKIKKYEIQERHGFTSEFWRNTNIPKGRWEIVSIEQIINPINNTNDLNEESN